MVAKRLDEPYRPGQRAMVKVKHARTADCVVAGFRWHKQGPGTMLGSLLLGLYDDAGKLHHVGIAASFTTKRRKELVEELAPLRENALRRPPVARVGGLRQPRRPRRPIGACRAPPAAGTAARICRGSRCASSASARSATTTCRAIASATPRTFVRWRPDKQPADCRYDQLEERPAAELAKLFGSGTTP